MRPRGPVSSALACMNDCDIFLNAFATRCFRNVADRDYICARMCYRAGLTSQFHWSALQAFEKYYKAIFLYNRIKAKNVRHDLAKARRKCQELPFSIRLSNTSTEFLDHLGQFARFRYLETSYYIKGPKLIELDKAVWDLRRYCQVLNYKINHPEKESICALDAKLRHLEGAEKRPYQEFRLNGGLLELILAKNEHPARAPLIWQNAFYGSSRRKKVSVPVHKQLENAPLALFPERLDHVLEYVYLPKEVIEAYRNAS